MTLHLNSYLKWILTVSGIQNEFRRNAIRSNYFVPFSSIVSFVSNSTLQTSKKMFQTFQPKLTHFYKRDGEPSKKYLWCCWTVINYKEENNLQKAFVKNLQMFLALLENIKLEMTTKKILNILKIKLFQSWYCSQSS